MCWLVFPVFFYKLWELPHEWNDAFLTKLTSKNYFFMHFLIVESQFKRTYLVRFVSILLIHPKIISESFYLLDDFQGLLQITG